MRLNLPWWLNPWAEVRRLRDEHFRSALTYGAEIRALRAEVTRRAADEDMAVRFMWQVQSEAASALREARFREGHLRAENEALRDKVCEVANLMPPVHFVRKDEAHG